MIYNDSLSATHELIRLQDHQVSVFPNPTTGIVNIQLDRQLNLTGDLNQYTLTSLDGRTQFQGQLKDYKTSVDLRNAVPGIYVLTLQVENKYQYNGKVVIIR
ncbi:MAG: T9SS type A sorting domain-containing protein [Saprospiraceae bacterium]|nr:T9SS type A sorting domain-containing protein [Candidatus Opimibacter iunctus]